VSTVLLPTTDLLDRVRAIAPELRVLDDALVHDAVEDLGRLAGVEFWVPGWVGRQRLLDTLAAMPGLRVIQTQSAGVDAYLPLVPEGVQLCDARGVHGSSTSEWALTAILSVLREFPKFQRDQQNKVWDGDGTTDELADKRVLIIGAGDVGQALARRVAACDAQPTMVARTARDGVHGTDELPGLLPAADVVVLIVPNTSETRQLVDARFLALMNDGALLVNAARGPVVDTTALLAELNSGRLRAALDVTDPEPLPADHPLWLAPNLLLTPHVGGAVAGLPARAATLVAAQLSRFQAGEPLQNVVIGEY
jgi:phosphoglycerate dehydrogenase-like enzyme